MQLIWDCSSFYLEKSLSHSLIYFQFSTKATKQAENQCKANVTKRDLAEVKIDGGYQMRLMFCKQRRLSQKLIGSSDLTLMFQLDFPLLGLCISNLDSVFNMFYQKKLIEVWSNVVLIGHLYSFLHQSPNCCKLNDNQSKTIANLIY